MSGSIQTHLSTPFALRASVAIVLHVQQMEIERNLSYFSGICLSLSILAYLSFADGHQIELMPIIWGVVGCAVVFEPLLLLEKINKRMKERSILSLFGIGCAVGLIVFGFWAGLYQIGLRFSGHEIYFIFGGYFGAMGIAALPLLLKSKAEPVGI